MEIGKPNSVMTLIFCFYHLGYRVVQAFFPNYKFKIMVRKTKFILINRAVLHQAHILFT
jgi:hypothetical protein